MVGREGKRRDRTQPATWLTSRDRRPDSCPEKADQPPQDRAGEGGTAQDRRQDRAAVSCSLDLGAMSVTEVHAGGLATIVMHVPAIVGLRLAVRCRARATVEVAAR